MARVQIDMPNKIIFSAELQVRSADVVAGLHLGNHILISYLNEVHHLFLSENNLLDALDRRHLSFINADLAIIFKSQSIHGDVLKIDMAVGEMNRCSSDLYFRVINNRSGLDVATAKMAMLTFDYKAQKPAGLPEEYRSKIDCMLKM